MIFFGGGGKYINQEISKNRQNKKKSILVGVGVYANKPVEFIYLFNNCQRPWNVI